MKKYLPILSKSSLFKGFEEEEILSALDCLSATVIVRERGVYIFREGDKTEVIGLVLSGETLIIQEDVWGHRNVLSKCRAGDIFGEAYAIDPKAVINVSVVAEGNSELLFLNVKRMLTSCSNSCRHHQKLIYNLMEILAGKMLKFNERMTHLSRRTTREKLLSYLSAESIKCKSLSFDISFDRQQLADYLCVDRAAMSVELSKLQKEGFLKTHKNHFQLSHEHI